MPDIGTLRSIPPRVACAGQRGQVLVWFLAFAATLAVVFAGVYSVGQAHSISASTTSSRLMGAFMMPSQVFCTCMRENAEYSASKLAAFMALMQIEPLARNRM